MLLSQPLCMIHWEKVNKKCPNYKMDFKVGDRVITSSSHPDDPPMVATVRFVGPVGSTSGVWIGVEWDDPGRGRHDGSHEGKRVFFTRHPTSGSFVRPHKLSKGVSLASAIRTKYGRMDCEGADVQKVLSDVKNSLGAAFVQVVGFNAVNQRQSNFSSLRLVSVKHCQVYGLGEEDEPLSGFIPEVRDLNLAENLISDWSVVTEIGRQLHKLRTLDLSNNHMMGLSQALPLLQPALLGLTQLVLNRMDLEWNDISLVVSGLANLSSLHVSHNQISVVDEIPEDALNNLTELDLSGNPVKSWNLGVLALGKLPKLEMLLLNRCNIEKIPDENCGLFPSLKHLQLSYNGISDWLSISNLNRLPLEDLRIRCNPVLELEDGDTCRQIIIASIKSLKVLNSTEIFRTERHGAELDYFKKFGIEYLDIVEKNDEKQLEDFFRVHPRYPEFVKVFGPLERAELREIKTDLKSTLLSVTILRADDAPPVVKKLPPGLTVHKLRTLLQRVVKRKAHELVLTFRSTEIDVPMDNDMRDLNYYNVADGDSIVVSW